MSAEPRADVSPTAGQFLRRLRRERRLSPEALAAAVGASRSTVDRWEKGVTVPQARLRERVAAVLGISVAELLQGLGMQPSTQGAKVYPLYASSGEGRDAPAAPRTDTFNADHRRFLDIAFAALDSDRAGNPVWVAAAAATAEAIAFPWKPPPSVIREPLVSDVTNPPPGSDT